MDVTGALEENPDDGSDDGLALEEEPEDVDSTGGECWLNLFNEQGEALFGRTADDMHALAPEAKERAIKAAQWKTGVFRLVRQLREWEGQRKVRVNASSMAQVDFAAESRILLQALKAL